MSQTQRLSWIDVLKGIGILLVIAGHSVRGEDSAVLGIIYDLIYAMHMPLFFSISGYLFGKSINEYKNQSTGQYISKKATGYLKPFFMYAFLIYFMFQIAFFIPAIGKSLEQAGMEGYNILTYICMMLLGENPYAFHLWYLWVLFWVTVLCYLIYKIGDFVGINGYTLCLMISGALWAWRMLAVYNTYMGLMLFLRYMIFFVIGIKLFDITIQNRTFYVVCSLFSFAYFVWHTLFKNISFGILGNFVCNILQLVSVLLLIHNFGQFSQKLSFSKILNYLGRNSLIIYLFHQPIFCAFVGVVCINILKISPIVAFVISFVTGLAATTTVIEIAKRNQIVGRILKVCFDIRVS